MGYGFVRAALAATLGLAPGAVAAQDTAVVPAEAAPAGFVAAVVEDVEPVMPTGASAGFVPPPRDATGFVTPNRNLSPEETTWHVRVALNVAALSCRGAEATEMVTGYNMLLTTDKAMLATTARAMGERYKARYGSAWQARHDDAMTKLYNYWALPPVQARFCGAALAVLREANGLTEAAFPAFAATALPRLEAPMLAFFEEFESYRVAREAWRTRKARAMIAAAVPAGPVVPAVVPGAAVAVAGPVVRVPVVAAPIRAGAGEP
ncbi:hypothetical protein GCM10011380_06780 [Sphingomonas metalli]|uniref:Uncharacterized protein n=1 Tax=Sphingomonas metalli TaxID=1779358 RepID=A0A916SWP5_9SPHN|nr:hypothetical protein [Sphingomonas metalli]GGB19875.1 hypothetical protein GCM10011380_06780 [Sphingomonas metalli]